MFSNVNSQKLNNNNDHNNDASNNSNYKRKLSDLSLSTTYSSLTNESQAAFRRSDNKGLLIVRANIYHEYDAGYKKNNNNNTTESNFYDEATDYSSYV